MTWTVFTGDTRRAGSSSLKYRVVFDGMQYEIVSHSDMVRAEGSYQEVFSAARVAGLSIKGEKISYNVDIPQGKLSAEGPSIGIVDLEGVWTSILCREPSNICWLTADTTAASTTITVTSTAGFPSSGVFWLDGEAIRYLSTTSTTFVDCTRGVYSSHAAYHYAGSATDGISTPEVTDCQTLLEGQRVSIYVYATGDDPQGNGTKIWQGIVTAEPRLNGARYTLQVDSIVSILKQKLGANLNNVAPRGVHYAPDSPTAETLSVLQWFEVQSSAVPEDVTAPRTQYGPYYLTGFWESNDEYVAYINAIIAAALVAVGPMDGSLVAKSDGASGWHFELTPGVNAYNVVIGLDSPVDGPMGAPYRGLGNPQVVGSTGPFQATVIANDTTYYYYPPPGVGAVPRGYLLRSGSRLYLSARVPSNATSAVIHFSDMDYPALHFAQTESDDQFFVGGPDSSLQSAFFALIGGDPSMLRAWDADNVPVVSLCLNFNELIGGGGNSLWNVLRRLTAMTPELANLGVIPPIYQADWSSAATSWQQLSTGAFPPVVNARSYLSITPQSLEDLIREELKLAGLIMGVDSSGALTVSRLRLAAVTEPATIRITSLDIVREQQKLQLERGAFGIWNTFEFQDGYNPVEDKFDGRDYVVRDVSAFSRSPSSRQICCRPFSQYVGPQPVSLEDLVALANRTLGVLGIGYSVWTVSVSAAFWNVEIGDTVAIDYRLLPSVDGTIGASPRSSGGAVDRTGIVVGWSAEFYSPTITLRILLSPRTYAGYVPSSVITSQSDKGSDVWDLVLSSTYFPDGSTAEDFWDVGDIFHIHRFDNSVGVTVNGTVISVDGNAMEVQLGGAWTPSTDSWFITFDDSDAPISVSQKRFVFVADGTSSLITYVGGAVPARVFGP